MTFDDLEPRIQGLPKVFKLPRAIILGMGKATGCKFSRYIHGIDPNKSPLKSLEKRERGYTQGLSNVLRTPNYLRNG